LPAAKHGHELSRLDEALEFLRCLAPSFADRVEIGELLSDSIVLLAQLRALLPAPLGRIQLDRQYAAMNEPISLGDEFGESPLLLGDRFRRAAVWNALRNALS
jgi:hypothetical protein